MDKKNNVKTKMIINTILTTVVLNIVSSGLYSWINSVDFITALKSIYKIIVDFLYKILTFSFSIWQIMTIIIFYVFCKKIVKQYKTNTSKEILPEFMNFTKGIYKGIHYSWKTNKYYNEVEIIDFNPVCDCGANLTYKRKFNRTYYSNPKLFCVNCNKIIEKNYDEEVHEDALLYFRNKLKKKIEIYNESIKSNNK